MLTAKVALFPFYEANIDILLSTNIVVFSRQFFDYKATRLGKRLFWMNYFQKNESCVVLFGEKEKYFRLPTVTICQMKDEKFLLLLFERL